MKHLVDLILLILIIPLLVMAKAFQGRSGQNYNGPPPPMPPNWKRPVSPPPPKGNRVNRVRSRIPTPSDN